MSEKPNRQKNIYNIRLIFKALDFAAIKHQFQKRKGADGIPYINHLIEVAGMILQLIDKPSVELLEAAILHDVIEDTDANEEEILKLFGEKVLNIILEVTDDMSLPYIKRKSLQIQKARYLSYEARCIKIADKTCNVRDILYTRIKWSGKRKIKYIQWAVKVVAEIRNTHSGLVAEFDEIVKQAEENLKFLVACR